MKDLIGTKDFERFSPLFKGKNGNCIAKFAMRLLAIDRVNRLYLSSCEHNGSDFAASLLNELGVNYRIGNGERLHELPTDSFITISNHPYGGLDGIMLIDLMASIRPDYKVMVNEILSMIKPMDTNFISVRPKGNKNIGVSTASVNGIRKALQSIQEGHPIGFFPSGAVSDLSLKEGCVRDREWQMSIIRLIQKAKVPVLPIRFFDKNSWFFYSLGLINWRVRLTRMPYEVFNKSKQNPRIAIGSIIPVETLNKYKDIESLRSFLRKSVYEMPKPTFYTSKQEIIFHNSFEGS
ncbi:MAG: lysophospholipid acyltransferase family protein [Bacteroidales bacterium]|nr:lysophospholipid acyltransferase family protein [Bacteroidales bacterium]